MDSNEIRQQFPYFVENADWIFFENAGGSQVTQSVIDRVTKYYSKCFVQVHAQYKQSNEASETVRLAHEFCLDLMNGRGIGEVILGSSTTQLIHTLGRVFEKIGNEKGQEIIVTNSAHEANYGIWTQLKGFQVKEWQIHQKIDLDQLENLLSDQTRIVALTHVSNLVGEILDIETITRLVHQRCPNARVIVDGVAFAPHRAVDVRQWNVDFYVFSLYKVYGPHMAVLYGSKNAWQELIDHRAGPNHFFIPQNDVRYQYEIGCLNHEGCAAILGIEDYFTKITRAAVDQPIRQTIEQGYDLFEKLETPLVKRLLTYLWSIPSVTVLGSQSLENRVPTISFTVSGMSAETVVKHLHANSIACRHGHMYAYRLLNALNIDLDDGVVRLSAVHYNTLEEIEQCIKVLDEILQPTTVKD